MQRQFADDRQHLLGGQVLVRGHERQGRVSHQGLSPPRRRRVEGFAVPHLVGQEYHEGVVAGQQVIQPLSHFLEEPGLALQDRFSPRRLTPINGRPSGTPQSRSRPRPHGGLHRFEKPGHVSRNGHSVGRHAVFGQSRLVPFAPDRPC